MKKQKIIQTICFCALVVFIFVAGGIASKAYADEAKDTPAGETKKSNWYDKIKLYGDLRYRFEFIQAPGNDTRDRHRLRARPGIMATPIDSLELNIRLATGLATDPVSTNQTLTNGFDNKAINLDLAYFDWHPEFIKGFHFIGGKVKNPFYAALNNQILWDSDLTPEGLAIQYKIQASDPLELFANAAAFFAQERADADNTWLFGGQAGAKVSFLEEHNLYVLAGLGFYLYTDTIGNAPLAATAAGNTVDAAGNYVEDYGTLEGLAEVGYNKGPYKLGLFGETVYNAKANNNRVGYIGGIKASRKLWENSELSFLYNYRYLKADAVLGSYTDSDFAGGGTNAKGHKFNLGFKLNKYVGFDATYLLNKTAVSGGNDYHRVQLDTVFKWFFRK